MYKVQIPEAYARVEWCKENFGPTINGGNWWRHKGYLYFRNEKDFVLYNLKWNQ